MKNSNSRNIPLTQNDQNQKINQKSVLLNDNNAANPVPEENLPTGKSRIFVANMPNDISEDDFKALFKKYGELTEVYISNKGFGFFKVASKSIAEQIKQDLDGTICNGRNIRVRIATAGTALKVLNLSHHATNETLIKAFSRFGPLDTAIVIADERGKSTGEGVVEFSKKNHAQAVMKRINEGVFLVTGSHRPVVVEPYEIKDYDTGVRERTLMKTPDYFKELSQEPRFAQPGSFEYEYGNKWKALYQQEKIQRELLEKKILEDREALENDMEASLQEHQTFKLRQDLMQKQEELHRMEEALRNRNKDGPKRDNFFKNSFNPYQQQQQQFNGANQHFPFPHNSNEPFAMQRNGPMMGNMGNPAFNNNPAAFMQGGGGGGGGSLMPNSGGMSQFNPNSHHATNPHAMHPANKQLTPGAGHHGAGPGAGNFKKPPGSDKQQQQQLQQQHGGAGGSNSSSFASSPKSSPSKNINSSSGGGGGPNKSSFMQENNKNSGAGLMGSKPLSLMNIPTNQQQASPPNSSLMGPPVPPQHFLNSHQMSLMMGQAAANMASNIANVMSGGGSAGGGGGPGSNNSNLIDPMFCKNTFVDNMNKRRRPF